MEENVARWARREGLEKEMPLNDESWRAYEPWKQLPPIPGIDAEPKLTREELHERL